MEKRWPGTAAIILLSAWLATAVYAESPVAPPSPAEGAIPAENSSVPLAADGSPEAARPLSRGHGAPTRTSSAQPAGAAVSAPWWRTTLSLAGVIGLIVLLGWGYRKMALGGGTLALSMRGRQPGLIEVISRAALSPRQSVCLVRVGPRLVLLGCTPDSVRPLDVIQDPEVVAQLAGQAARRRAHSHTEEFTRCLERESHAYQPPAVAAETTDETVLPEEARLRAMKEMLTGAVRRLRTAAGA